MTADSREVTLELLAAVCSAHLSLEGWSVGNRCDSSPNAVFRGVRDALVYKTSVSAAAESRLHLAC